MKTRLTEILDVEHPVMLAGMGGVSYAPSGGRGLRGRRVRVSRCVDHERRADGRRDRQGAGGSPTSRSESTCSRPCRVTWRPRSSKIIAGGASVFVAGLGVPVEVVDLCHRARAPRDQHVRQGRPRPARRGRRVRHRRGPGDRGRRPHRTGRHHAARPPDRRRRRGRDARSSPPAGSSTGAAWRRRSASGADGVWVGTRFIATPEARAVAGYKDALLAPPRTAPPSVGPTRARRCGWCATSSPGTSTSIPTSSPVPGPARQVHRGGRLPPRRRRRDTGGRPRP